MVGSLRIYPNDVDGVQQLRDAALELLDELDDARELWDIAGFDNIFDKVEILRELLK